MSEKSYKITLWASVIGSIVLVVGGIIALAIYSDSQQPGLVVPGVSEVTATDHWSGTTDAPVTLVEYGDFQCPACGAYFPIIKEVDDKYGDRIRFVFRNFPLPQHSNARPAAYVAEAAGLQGKYWEMHDLLYKNQDKWAEVSAKEAQNVFGLYAVSLSLDMTKYDADKVSDAVRLKVDGDQKSGSKAGVDSTPTFFLNGRKIQPQTYDDFAHELDAVVGPATPAVEPEPTPAP